MSSRRAGSSWRRCSCRLAYGPTKSTALPRECPIVPTQVFFYEMLPVNVPGPIDDWLAVTCSGTSTVIAGINRMASGGVRQPGESNRPTFTEADPAAATPSQDEAHEM